MRRIRGTYTFYLHTFKNPNRFSVYLEGDTLLEIQFCGRFFEFALTSGTQQNDVFWAWINVSADSLGFLLDFPIYSSYSTTFEEITQPHPDSTTDAQIDFDFVEHTMEYNQTAGHYINVELSKKLVFSTSEIRNFIAKVRANKLLDGAIGYYLKSIEEPEFFLASLYNAYELIKNTGVVSKTKANKFTRLANDINVIGSRHTSKQASKLRSLSPDEREYCRELIRIGILQLAHNI